ncbi:putative cyanide hydratase protein [Botrytis fragariae]|uniref:nitrilase n=1 Tax=Botrytis fragariae TaxID=1964551 RepID=A0A8H6AQI8_9HELO|nr:putative cyanide hydratase protein [Botrytis fragariae]KAF5871794.1 putative cyanide hydratase protein [Botrytis fragariae]
MRQQIISLELTQAEPEWLDLEKAVDKTCRLIVEAATNGAKLITFPECWIPGCRPVDFEPSIIYIKNSLQINSPQMAQICACVAENNINVSVGFSENDNNSIYISQVIIRNDGRITMARRKLKPTHMERTVFGDASGNCLKNVAEVPGIGRFGALACWELAQSLLKYNTIPRKEDFHVAAWPPVFEHDGGPGLWSMSKEAFIDVGDHYSRPDMLWLGTDDREKKNSRTQEE